MRKYGKGWIMIIYALVCYFLTATIGTSMNVAAGVLNVEKGWDSAVVTSFISIANVANVIMGFVMGRICIHTSAKKLGILLAGVYSVCIIFLGMMPSVLLFGILMVIANAAATAWGYNVNPIMISKWFPRRKGTVMGIATAGVPLGAGLVTIIYSTSYKHLGLGLSFMPFAMIAVLTMFILVIFLADDPRKVNYEPDNDAKVKENEIKEQTSSVWSVKKVLKTKVVWIIAISLGVQFMFCSGLSVQLVPMLTEHGISMDKAIRAMMLMAVSACVGSIICGKLDTRIGAKKSAVYTFFVGIASMVCMLLGNRILIYVAMALIGVTIGGASNWPVSICIEFFGPDDFAKGYSVVYPIIQLVGAFGASFFALLSKATGSYTFPCVLISVMLGVFGILLHLTFIKNDNYKKEMR